MFGKYKKLRKQIERLIVKIEDEYSDTDAIKASYVLQDLYDLIGEEYDEIPFKMKHNSPLIKALIDGKRRNTNGRTE